MTANEQNATPDLVIVGAGIFGLTIAQQAVEKLGVNVTIIDIRDHIGGNAYSYMDPETGAEIHKYGAHLFHTSNSRVWEYVNRFTKFTDYVHRVYATHDGEVFPLPINLGTINQFFRANYTPAQAKALIDEQAGELAGTDPANLNDQGISLIGRPLYEAFIKNYTAKRGRPIRASCRRASSSVCRCVSTTTTGISKTRGKVCRQTATPRGLSA